MKRLRLALLLVVLCMSFAVSTLAQSGDDTYQFPIMPGTREWQAFQTHDEMLVATQIPADLLSKMSTRGLVKTVLGYPLFGDIWAFNSVQQGFDIVTSNFNGLQALLTRKDAGQELLALYEQMNPAFMNSSWSVEQRGSYVFDVAHVEFLLAQKPIVDTLLAGEREHLLRLALSYYEQKTQMPNEYGRLSIETTFVLMGRLLYYSSNPSVFTTPVLNEPSIAEIPETNEAIAYPPYMGNDSGVKVSASATDPVLTFLQYGAYASDKVLDYIEGLARQTLSGNVMDEKGVGFIQDSNSTVYTPYGSSVSVITRDWELSSTEIKRMNKYVADDYPNATRETDASRKYNCHSYAWYSTSTSNDRWMNSPSDDIYWNDGSYVLLSTSSSGHKVSYPSSSDHSAIQATSSSTQLRSKWGPYPRMLHAHNYSPYPVGTGLKYYRLASTCPTITAWKGEYWNNMVLSGTPRLCRNDSAVDFNWRTGSPRVGIPSDYFSARWTLTQYFAAGIYRFTIGADDGFRLYVDDVRIVNEWGDGSYRTRTVDRNLTRGNHTIRVEYYERTGDARVYLSWVRP